MVTVMQKKENRIEKLVVDEHKLDRLYQSGKFLRIDDGGKFSSSEVEKAIERVNREEEYNRTSDCYTVCQSGMTNILWCGAKL